MKPLAIAHRGKHDIYFENTLNAFKEAACGDYYGVETDIHLTKDKRWITHHDSFFYSGGIRYEIADLTFEEIMKLHLDNNQNDNLAYCCPFEDYLSVVTKGNKRPIIEFKIDPSEEKMKSLCDYIDKSVGLENVTFICFSPYPLLMLKRLYKSRVHLQQLVYDIPELVELALKENIGIDIHYGQVSKELVDRFHDKGLEFNAWTVDSKDVLNKLETFGVDYITSNLFNQKS